jgi:hypothetical protein
MKCSTCQKPMTRFSWRVTGKRSFCSKACQNESQRQSPEAFWRRVQIGDADECWPWTGCILAGGYGQLRWRNTQYPAHRLALILSKGPIPDALDAMHSCDNPLCCNPKHLSAGTKTDNMRDASIKERMSHKLTAEQVRQIRNDGRPMGIVAVAFGVSCQHVRRIKHGVRRYNVR